MFDRIEFRAAIDAGWEYLPGHETRADVGDDRKLRGTAIVFNKRSLNLGGFFEIIRPQAVDRTIESKAEVRALVDHETRLVIGNTSAGTLGLKKDKTGLRVDIDVPNTTYGKDLVEVVRRGDVHGMSFRFRVMPDGDEWDILPDGTLIRYVNDMQFDEVSAVTFPAYTDTQIDVLRKVGMLDMRTAQRSLAAFQERSRGNIEWLRRMEKLKASAIWQSLPIARAVA